MTIELVTTDGIFALDGGEWEVTNNIWLVGDDADVVVFDPDTVADTATFDAPKRPAAGIDLVMVNGRIVWQDGTHTGALPGRALRRGDLDPPRAAA